MGESASPFIDEGDGLTRERERVRMLLSLVAHAVGYRIVVGTHNTVDVRRIWGEPIVFIMVWELMAPTTL